MARRGDLWACVFKGAVLKYCHKANAETERVPRGQSIESGGHGLKAAAEKSRLKCIREPDAGEPESEPHTGYGTLHRLSDKPEWNRGFIVS